MRRLLLLSVLGCLLALPGVVLTSLPAQACSCVAGQTLSAQSQRATDVLIGTVAGRTSATGGSASYDVRVERVYKGRAEAVVTVRTPSSQGSCGIALVADRRYLLVGTRQAEIVEVNSCGGTRPARPGAITQATQLLGEGRVPVLPPVEPAEPSYETLEERPAPGFARLAAPGAAIALVGFLGLLLVRRVGRPH